MQSLDTGFSKYFNYPSTLHMLCLNKASMARMGLAYKPLRQIS